MRKNPQFENIVKWHQDLHESDRRGAKAMLKRCKTISEIYLNPAYVKLVQDVGCLNEQNPKDTLAVLAGVLSHVKPAHEMQEGQRLPLFSVKIAISPKGGGFISPVRFRQLLACNRSDKLLRLLIRIVSQVNDFDIMEFTKSLYYWNLKSKKSWAFDYYSNLPDKNKPKGA